MQHTMDEPPSPLAPALGGGSAPAAPAAPEAAHYLQLLLLERAMLLVALLTQDEDGAARQVLYASPGVTLLLGFTPEEYVELCSTPVRESLHPDDVRRVLSQLGESRAARGHAWRSCRYREARKDGTWAEVESLYTTRGDLLYGITREATAVSAEQRVLKDLLQSTSFDLRCNATSIVSAASLLRNRPSVTADSEAAFLADAVRTSCDLLSGLAANVLELRRLERGELRPTRVPFCVHSTLRSVIQMCVMAKSSGADLAWEDEARAAELLPPYVMGDPMLIGLVVQNLLTNAMKFCRNSRVLVHVALEQQQQRDAVLRVDVEDHGVGIAADSLERIFHRFERAPQDKGGGAGLGLHISRGFARAMGGDVCVRSVLGEGSTFTLRVPIRIMDADEAAAALAGGCVEAQAPSWQHAAPAPDFAARVRANAANCRRPVAPVDPFAEVSLDEMLQQLLAETREIFMYTAPLGRETYSRIAYISPSVRTVLGWDPAELVGQRGTFFFHPDDVEKHAAATAAMWARDAPTAAVMPLGMRRLRRADGGYLWMHVEAARVGDRYFGLLRDATQSMESQRSLKEYLLSTSHDMRTPVTVIIAAAELLEARPGVRADSEAAFLVLSIKSSGQLMDSTISNVMELRMLGGEAEGSSSQRVLRLSPFDPRALAEDVLAATCAAMRGDPNCVHVSCGPLPACVVADAERTRRMLQNLFSTLLRHATDDTQLSIRLCCAPPASDGRDADALAELQLELRDTARDVADADLELMFSPLHSLRTPCADSGPTHTSLGMCVSRDLARAMGGAVFAQRSAPHGAPPPSGVVIHLRVPVRVTGGGEATAAPLPLKRASPDAGTAKQAAAPSAPVTPISPVMLQHKRLLLVEDHDLIRALVSKLLRATGFVVSTACNGAEALAALQAAAASGAALPDAVLTDVQMPVMDGLAFTRAFRSWEASRLSPSQPPLPIFALSANVLDEHVAAAYAAGVTRHFAKPLRGETVQEIRRLLRCDEAP